MSLSCLQCTFLSNAFQIRVTELQLRPVLTSVDTGSAFRMDTQSLTAASARKNTRTHTHRNFVTCHNGFSRVGELVTRRSCSRQTPGSVERAHEAWWSGHDCETLDKLLLSTRMCSVATEPLSLQALFVQSGCRRLDADTQRAERRRGPLDSQRWAVVKCTFDRYHHRANTRTHAHTYTHTHTQADSVESVFIRGGAQRHTDPPPPPAANPTWRAPCLSPT